MYCKFCGQYMKEDHLFCKNCGKSVNEEYTPQNNNLNYEYNYSISDVPAVIYEDGFFFKGVSSLGRFWILVGGVLMTMIIAFVVFALLYSEHLAAAISYISRMFI